MRIPNSKALARLGPRGTFGLALQSVAEEDGRVLGLAADLAVTAGMERFRLTYPERFFNVGIAEQNLVGVAAGLADDGWVPFAVTFANFAALRACEMVRHHMGYMRQNVKLVGIGAGFAMGQFGTTHYSVEDVAALRGIPNLTIVSPADCSEVVDAVRYAVEVDGPVYLRLTGVPSMPPVDQRDSDFAFGRGRTLRLGTDVTIIACGSMVERSLAAAELLGARGVSVGVVNMHTLKPIDETALDDLRRGVPVVVTVEEHSVIGGLGGAVTEYLSNWDGAPAVLRIGIDDMYPRVGDYDWVLDQCGLTSSGIAERILTRVQSTSV